MFAIFIYIYEFFIYKLNYLFRNNIIILGYTSSNICWKLYLKRIIFLNNSLYILLKLVYVEVAYVEVTFSALVEGIYSLIVSLVA